MERQRDGNKDTKVDEIAQFQKLAEMQESMTNLGKSGGVYIPPFNLARMMNEVQDSMEYQKMTWVALRKSINGGRGLFCRSCMKSQMASPGFKGRLCSAGCSCKHQIP
ncbi:hypothetical protein L6452_41809 [Arctium lappa]|uniref:Uncharacterized protein n=1 Tax=Arctium lappa TaxID=4217 RepID=A0ACB8XH31_ARCLA|nr:hypothetical protein L6452_41809 [Arctium lappa]